MKKLALIVTTLGLFGFSVYLAFLQGSRSLVEQNLVFQDSLQTQMATSYGLTGLKALVASSFTGLMNVLLAVTNHSVLWAMVVLALIIELVLLYPSVRIQLKQKKIHLLHKKVIDRFTRGELSMSLTKEELYKIYDVNEKIHRRGAVLVTFQVLVFLFTFWGLGLLARMPELLKGSWSVLDYSILAKPQTFALPLLASLVYFLHAMVKIYAKEREDFISPLQSVLAMVFALLGSALIYYFAHRFAIALGLYFITLVTFATVRYIVVEREASQWGKLAYQELLQMLRDSKPHENRFQYFSRKWNHIPIIRYINFNLLEEALSMTIGLLLALSFFGAFQPENTQFQASIQTPASQMIMHSVADNQR